MPAYRQSSNPNWTGLLGRPTLQTQRVPGPASRAQILTVLSPLQEARASPEGAHATDHTLSLWPSKHCTSCKLRPGAACAISPRDTLFAQCLEGTDSDKTQILIRA